MPLERLPPLLFSRCVSVFRRRPRLHRRSRSSFRRRGRKVLVVSVRRFSSQSAKSVRRLDAILFQNAFDDDEQHLQSGGACAAMRCDEKKKKKKKKKNNAKTSRRGPLLRRASGRQQTRRTRTTCRREREGFIVFFARFCAEKKTSKMTLSRSINIRDSNQKEKNTRGVCVLCAFLCGKEERMMSSIDIENDS